MNTIKVEGQAMSEQQTPPTDANGASSEVNRSVSWTAHSAGFAELKARATYLRDDALAGANLARNAKFEHQEHVARGIYAACVEVLRWIDELSGCEGRK